MGCRDIKGNNCHRGRSGEPIILIIGDEATPSAVGYSRSGEQIACCWIFKKEHLGLSEVTGILKRLNKEKKEWDRECGRRAHDFFLPNGSKILVGSYTNLRREGLGGGRQRVEDQGKQSGLCERRQKGSDHKAPDAK